MRKGLIATEKHSTGPSESSLDLDAIATVQVTSEEEAYPIESALLPDGKMGWRAASQGTQTVRLIFDNPQKLHRIWLAFAETQYVRTQEFVLRWSPDNGRSFREIVRQQWNFSAPDSTRETEDYTVDLSGATVLELIIVPDKSDGEAKATLEKLRLF